ncbi:disulfide bond formation protein DsbA [Caulobacter sp. B11]|uniref:DsbA family protein n=1 Tax=Caulobacter sp. B11 TaxID=2048899 RepID=UPI000C12BB0D|nr:DsbA family protein [Caulobacter sp. B11]PHY13121.1 disulfide bond formation protein DsbA [Caulobacter sp. B11]
MRSLTSRLLLALALTVGLAGCTKTESVNADDMSLGNASSKITVVEYASVTCSHCARWSADVFPAFKAKYIDSGKVNFVYREFPTAPENVAVAGFLVARCAGKDKYFEVLDALYRQQMEVVTNPLESLTRIAQSVGLDEAQFKACVSDEKALKAMNDRTVKFAKEADIRGTPTFVVNGKKVGGDDGGEVTLEQLDTAIAAAGK